MTNEQKEGCASLTVIWLLIAALLAMAFFSCKVQKVSCGSQVRIPVTTVTIKPDSSRTYNTIFVPYCDSVLIYIQPGKK
jgi:hypothetical protein